MSSPWWLDALSIWTIAAKSFWTCQMLAIWLRPRPRSTIRRRPCTVIRPCAGHRVWLRPALDSLEAALSRGDRVILAVASTDDAAYPTVASWAREHANLDVVVVLGGPVTKNRKVARLCAAQEHVRHDVIVLLDDDVLVERDLLDELVDAADRTQGAAWAAPFESPTGRSFVTAADRASAAILGCSAQSFVAIGTMPTGGDPTFVGKACALHPRAFEAIGCWENLGDLLGEDQGLARRLHDASVPIVMVPRAARSLAQGRTFEDVVARYARWLWVVRAQRPWLLPSYPLLILPWIPLLACWVALAAGGVSPARIDPSLVPLTTWLWYPAFELTFLRLALSWTINRRLQTGRAISAAADAVLADLVLWRAFFRTLGRETVTWRGNDLTLESGRVRQCRAIPPQGSRS